MDGGLLRRLLSKSATDGEQDEPTLADGGVVDGPNSTTDLGTDESIGTPTPAETGPTSGDPTGDGGGTEMDVTASLLGNLDVSTVLDAVDVALLVVDANGEVVVWNERCEAVTDVAREAVMGVSDIGGVLYDTDRTTLAEKVYEHPETAHVEYDGVGVADDEYAMLEADEGTVFEDTSTLGSNDADIWFIAAPVYEDSEFAGVVEIIQERDDSARRKAEIHRLFDAVSATLASYRDGEFSARVQFDDEDTVLDEELLAIVDRTNETGRSIERTIDEVQGGVDDLADSLAETVTSARDIDGTVSEQTAELRSISEDMADFSASMEEVAASSQQVSASVAEARQQSEEGLEAIESAQTRSGDAIETTDALVETVSELGGRMDEVSEVAEIIGDIAEQTNMLALNANIEAARADSDGFGVVADEVKSLADDTRRHTEEIADELESLQTHADEAVDSVEAAHENVAESDRQVDTAATAFEQTAEEIGEAADGIAEIATANDRQANTVESVTATIDGIVDRAERVDDLSAEILSETRAGREAAEGVESSLDELQTERTGR